MSSEQLQNLAHHLEQEKNLQELLQPERNAFELLRNVNTISAHIPGSNASKLLVCNCICSYFGMFGMPLIYLTLNPCAAHSPIFQLFYGDTTVDLTMCHPTLVSSTEHAICLSHDPVTACDFF